MFDDTYGVYLQVLTYYLPSCAKKFVTLLVLRLACLSLSLSNVKVVFWHVLEYHNLQVFISGVQASDIAT